MTSTRRFGRRARAALLLLSACALAAAPPRDARAAGGGAVRLNTVGYLPQHEKRATLPAPCGEFRIVRAVGGAVVLRGDSSGPARDDETGEDLCVADFDALREPGLYRLEAGAARSAPFRVGRDVYAGAFRAAVRAMHLWRCFERKFSADWGWGDVKNLGMLTYLFSARAGRDARLVRQLREELIETADGIVLVRDRSAHARPLTRYYWGANGGVAGTAVLLRAAHRVAPKPAYVEAALDAVSHLLGRNFYGRSFVTGVGSAPPRAPHDRRSMAPGSAGVWPGYLVGGGWPRATDWVDDAENYRVNEIAINWNAPLVYALAAALPRTRRGV